MNDTEADKWLCRLNGPEGYGRNEIQYGILRELAAEVRRAVRRATVEQCRQIALAHEAPSTARAIGDLGRAVAPIAKEMQ